MSTIASPRDTSVNGRRGHPLIITPTTSARPSFDTPRSSDPSPNRSSQQALPKRNRAALREYYNLKASQAAVPSTSSPQDPETTSLASSIHDNSSHSSVVESELDSADFNAPEYIRKVLENQSLTEVLKTYNGVLGDIRALDAEKKALVYDNYSKLIKATETIGKMREDMGKGGSGGGVGIVGREGVLDAAVRGVFERAEALRGELRKELEGDEGGRKVREEVERKQRVRVVVERVLQTPAKVRVLMNEEKEQEAREVWKKTLMILERWKERGVGGSDVQDCIDDGEAALKREELPDKKTEASRQDTES